jgi:hypothetical protein
MASQDLMTYKCKGLSYTDVGGGASAVYTPLMGVLEGLSITQDAAEETPIPAEFYDFPFDNVGTLGSYVIEFDLVKYKPEEIVAMEGGTFDAATGMYELPSSFQNVFKQFKLEFYNGIDYLIIWKGKVATNWSGSDLKTAPVALHVRITALVDDNGKVVSKKMAEPTGNA